METARKRRRVAGVVATALVAVLTLVALAGCSDSSKSGEDGSKTLVYGTTSTWSTENEDHGFDPHSSYCGWTTIRLGVGETLFKFDDNMQIQPWIASGYEFTDDTTCVVTIKDNVTFSNGKKVDGAAVKACLDDLVARHDRAPSDLKITSIEADGQKVTIHTSEANPALVYYLSDPYGCIVDMSSPLSETTVIGTGPYTVESTTEDTVELAKNPNYWDGTVNVDHVTVKNITDGDTLTMALQNGEIQAAYGLPYSSLGLFSDSQDYNVSSTSTSRVYECAFNFHRPVMQDANVRKAIAMSLNSSDFVNVLLDGHGESAVGAFPSNFKFALDSSDADSYDLEAAKQLLASDGYSDTDDDGYLEKDGQRLEITWLTYPSRQELPKLAEYAQEQLKKIGIKVNVNSTANHKSFVKSDDFDVYASSIVAAPQGDPQYYFTTQYLPESSYDAGHYSNPEVTANIKRLSTTFDADQRAELAKTIQRQVLQDNGYYYASFLQMSIVSKSNVSGLTAHPCDYYELTADLKVS
jgi:peptide/nickel transport system substrate-binding protein